MGPRSEQQNPDQQAFAAIPYRRSDGKLEFCLITSSRGRLGFPKGFVDPGETIAQATLKEAFEEAGLHGRIRGVPLGSYPLEKSSQEIPVTVVLMKVSRSDEHWQEEDGRQRQWVAADDAACLIAQPEQREFLALALKQL